MKPLPHWALASLAISVLAAPVCASAQDRPVPVERSGPSSAASTRILAIGTLTKRASPTTVPQVLQDEVPATLRLYLAGKIDAWYAKTDQTGVVFILDVRSIVEAHALLDPLPLGRAGMMSFEFIPLGPLRPLGILLHQPAK